MAYEKTTLHPYRARPVRGVTLRAGETRLRRDGSGLPYANPRMPLASTAGSPPPRPSPSALP